MTKKQNDLGVHFYDLDVHFYDMAVTGMAKHVLNMAQCLENAAREMRQRAAQIEESAALEKKGEKLFSSPMDYYAWSINTWTNVQSNLRLDLVPMNTSAFVLARKEMLR